MFIADINLYLIHSGFSFYLYIFIYSLLYSLFLTYVNYLMKFFCNLHLKIWNKSNIIIQAISQKPIFLTKILQILHGQFSGFQCSIVLLVFCSSVSVPVFPECSAVPLRYAQAFVFKILDIVSPVLTFLSHETSLTSKKCRLAKLCKVDA